MANILKIGNRVLKIGGRILRGDSGSAPVEEEEDHAENEEHVEEEE